MVLDLVKKATNGKSAKLSFKGYDYWLATKDQLKELLRIGIPLAISLLATRNPAYVAIATVIGRYITTAFEYFYTEYK